MYRADLRDIFSISLEAEERLSQEILQKTERSDFLQGTDKSGREISQLKIIREPSWILTMELEQSVVPIAFMNLIQTVFVLRKFDPEIDRTLQTQWNAISEYIVRLKVHVKLLHDAGRMQQHSKTKCILWMLFSINSCSCRCYITRV